MKALIVDTNAIHRLLGDDTVGSKLWQALLSRDVHIVGGGTKYRDEVIRSPLRELFVELVRSGSIILYENNEIDNLEKQCKAHPEVTSDDEHILSIADRSGCRVLFSEDKALTADFKNSKILSKPRGKVMCKKFYAHILLAAPHCRP